MKLTKWTVAVHEASHIVTSMAMNCPAEAHIDCTPAGEWHGTAVIHGYDTFAKLVAVVGGPIGKQIICGGRYAPSESDAHNARQLALELSREHGEYPIDWIRKARIKAHLILIKRQNAIEKTARKLIREHRKRQHQQEYVQC